MIEGRAWVLGDRIDTDVLAPGHLMKLPPEELAKHCLRAVVPEFAGAVRPGDVIVAGEGFGVGSSREQAVVSLRVLGVGAVVARSFGRIFWRNALNLGLPALELAEDAAMTDGARVRVDPRAATLTTVADGRVIRLRALPGFLLDMVEAGGLEAKLARRGREALAGRGDKPRQPLL